MSSHTYTTVAELKRVHPKGQDVSDTVYANVIAAVTAGIDEKCGRRFDKVSNEARIFEKDFNSLGNFPKMEVDDIQTLGMTTVKVEYAKTPVSGSWVEQVSTSWWLQPLTPKRGWPKTELAVQCEPQYGYNFVRITADWGWDAVPNQIVRATLMWSNRILSRESTPYGIMEGSTGSTYIGKMDSDVEALVLPFKKDRLL